MKTTGRYLTNINMAKQIYIIILTALVAAGGYAAENQPRWTLAEDGGIEWTVGQGDSHTDHIEMSGRQVSVIVTYGTDADGRYTGSRRLVFPMLRTIPNNTHGNVICSFGDNAHPEIKINNRSVRETPVSFHIRGTVRSVSSLGNDVFLTREVFPSVDKPLVIERMTIVNGSQKTVEANIENFDFRSYSPPEKSVYGVYRIGARTAGHGVYELAPGQEVSFSVLYEGCLDSEPWLEADTEEELGRRKEFVDQMFHNIRLVSPDPVLDRMFEFAKIRAMESIYQTRGGLVHSPGGGSYYAAIWANDQAEYANPLFAYTGYDIAIKSAMTSWRWFADWMNPEYKPIPSSIIAEGTGYWNGAGDRGDMAMIAYGAGRFALALGDRENAEEVWPLIEWCLEYCRRQLDANGVVKSDSDELENRFPSGDANLCTSALYYDALISATYLGRDLGKPRRQVTGYEKQAVELGHNIEKFFGTTVQGFNTYRYYDGNDILRSWICIPLTVDLFDRADGTLDALFSPLLWTEDGLLTQQGLHTFWDRSTLYGLRGAFAAGATSRALPYLQCYSQRRLLGDHVPYAVEAWPEGNQRHLSAESALYCRIVTEGLFGFRPTGLARFELAPQLPEDWDRMELHSMIAHGKEFDIFVADQGGQIRTEIVSGGTTRASFLSERGEKITVDARGL